jgi:hypothetical protein
MALLSRSRSLSNSAMIDCVSNGVALLVFRVATILQDKELLNIEQSSPTLP